MPVYFPGANSRAYQIANRISPTLRQGLLLHEVVHALNRPQTPVIRPAISGPALAARMANTTDFMAWLRAVTLGEAIAASHADQRVGVGVSPA